MTETLLALLLAHMVGDFVLQSRSQIAGKAAVRLAAFLRHGAIHWLLSALLVLLFARPDGPWRSVAIVALLAAGHVAIDAVKERIRQLRVAAKAWAFLGDQLGHLGHVHRLDGTRLRARRHRLERAQLVGLVIAAEAIIRFEETDKDFAEYFLLGTFLSLLFAGAGALVLRTLLGG